MYLCILAGLLSSNLCSKLYNDKANIIKHCLSLITDHCLSLSEKKGAEI